jgi:hypothetical protein
VFHWPDCYSAQTVLLPFVEQIARYEMFVSTIASAGGSYVAGFEPFEGMIPVYLCPSDPSSAQPGFRNFARSNIVISLGDGICSTIYYPDGDVRTRSIFNPFYDMSGYSQDTHPWKNMSAIQDGTSNTIAASEAVSDPLVGSDFSTNTVRGGVRQITTGWTTLTGPLQSGCLNYQSGTTFSGSAYGDHRCSLFPSGNPVFTAFQTVFPPNSLSCALDDSPPRHGQRVSLTLGVFSATSYHTGGVNTMNFDGTVRFISETINCNNSSYATAITASMQLGRESYFGVWGAPGSPDGGETKNP